MTKREVGILACRLLALYAWIQSLHYVPAVLDLSQLFYDPWSRQQYVLLELIASAVPFVLLLGLAIFVWRRAGLISAWIFAHDIQDHQLEPESNPHAVQLEDIQVVAFSTVGLWLLLDVMPQAAAYSVQLIYAYQLSDFDLGYNLALLAKTIEVLLRVAAGFWLLFGARGLVNLLRKLRTAGVEKPD